MPQPGNLLSRAAPQVGDLQHLQDSCRLKVQAHRTAPRPWPIPPRPARRFDRAIDRLLDDERKIVQDISDLPAALRCLLAGQVEFVVADREVAQVYHREINNLPEEDRRRLRRKQRLPADLPGRRCAPSAVGLAEELLDEGFYVRR
jgi:hypothetical protein